MNTIALLFQYNLGTILYKTKCVVRIFYTFYQFEIGILELLLKHNGLKSKERLALQYLMAKLSSELLLETR